MGKYVLLEVQCHHMHVHEPVIMGRGLDAGEHARYYSQTSE